MECLQLLSELLDEFASGRGRRARLAAGADNYGIAVVRCLRDPM